MDHGTIPDAVEATSKGALRIESGDIPSFTEARNQLEREYLTKVLQMTNGNVAKAARIAKRNRTEFYKLLHKHHLSPPQFKAAQH